MVVTSPSLHGSVNFYRWFSSETLKLDEIPEIPMEKFGVLKEHLSSNGKFTSPHMSQNQFLIQNQSSHVSKNLFSPVDVVGRKEALEKQTGSLLGRGFPVDPINHETTKWNNKNPTPLSEDERIPQLIPSLETMEEKIF